MASDSVGAGALKVVSERSERQLTVSNVGQAPKRSKKKVLEEEEFVEKVDKIIERDFFPYLDEVRKRNNYLDALDSEDSVRIAEAEKALAASSTRVAETPSNDDWDDEDWVKSTPGPSTSGERFQSHDEKMKKSVEGVSLSKFMANNTSEDNDSFSEIMINAEQARRKKLDWVYKHECSENDSVDKALMPPPLAPSSLETKALDTWNYKVHNAVMYNPEGAPLTSEELQKAKDAQPKVQHGNTRLIVNPWCRTTPGSSTPSLSDNLKNKSGDDFWNGAGKVGIDGKSSWETASPKVRGFSYVATPSPRPGVGESPLMTWGEVESTPYLIAGESSSKFKMNAPSEREQLAMSLAEKNKVNKKKTNAIKAAQDNLVNRSVPQSPSFAGLSPAAKRLALGKLGIIRGSDRGLMASYTPGRDKKKLDSARTVSPYPSPAPRTPNVKTPTVDLQTMTKARASDFF